MFKSALTIIILLAIIVLCVMTIAESGERIPPPFDKAKEIALRERVQIHTDGTGYQQFYYKNGKTIITFGYDGRSIWVGSTQWTGVPIVISYYDKEKYFSVVTVGMKEEVQVLKEEEKIVIERAFEVFRKAVSLGII